MARSGEDGLAKAERLFNDEFAIEVPLVLERLDDGDHIFIRYGKNFEGIDKVAQSGSHILGGIGRIDSQRNHW